MHTKSNPLASPEGMPTPGRSLPTHTAGPAPSSPARSPFPRPPEPSWAEQADRRRHSSKALMAVTALLIFTSPSISA